MIGDDIEITILGVKAGQVKIAVTAPTEIPVHRKEIWERIRAEKEEADERREG